MKQVFLLLAMVMVASACGVTERVRPDPPRVSVDSVRPLNLSLTRQKLAFALRVENPNAFDLPLRELTFTARLAGEKIADGQSTEQVTIPANGEAIVRVDVTAGMASVLARMRQMLADKTIELDYVVEGFVRLTNWPRRIPFDVEGILPNLQGEPNAPTE